MHSSPRSTAYLDRIYVHTNEGPEGDRSAWGLLNYLQTISAGYHVIVDNKDTVRAAEDDQTLEACGGDNTHSLNVCIIGYAGQSPLQWKDPYSVAEIERAARQVAAWCRVYRIPCERIHPGSPPTDRGIGGHVDNHHPNSDGHSDPGPYFPWDYFLARVRALLNPQPKVPPMFSPAPAVVAIVTFRHPTLGYVAAGVTHDGAVYCNPAGAYLGGGNHGASQGKDFYDTGRRASSIRRPKSTERSDGMGYVIVAESGEKYGFYPH